MPSDFFHKFIFWTERFYLKDLEILRMLVVKTSCYLSSFKSYGHLNSEKICTFQIHYWNNTAQIRKLHFSRLIISFMWISVPLITYHPGVFVREFQIYRLWPTLDTSICFPSESNIALKSSANNVHSRKWLSPLSFSTLVAALKFGM